MWVVKEESGIIKGFGTKPYYIEGKWGVSVENGIPIFGFNFNEYIVLAVDPNKFSDIENNKYFNKFSKLKVNYPIEIELVVKKYNVEDVCIGCHNDNCENCKYNI